LDEETLSQSRYLGRFAPSPTGPLHFGSLVAAVASYIDARAHKGQWLVRIEDVDEPRTVPGAADEILRCLESYGLHWDGEIVFQSQRKQLYGEALARLGARVFPCGCSRRPGLYPGTCRKGLGSGMVPRAWRLRVDDEVIEFDDRLQGRQVDRLAESTGDFVLLRADGFFAYQLAVVVDDAAQGVTDIVRGEDLLESTGRQILLRRLLGYGKVRHMHIPIVRGTDGTKLSKQTYARPVPHGSGGMLTDALRFLGLQPPPELSTIAKVLEWACNQPLLDCKEL
jgi:glutamyl-Q tRNA(Asp) synthetase